MLDDMHKRKIDMADEIYVINVGGYIGESTRSEIESHLAHQSCLFRQLFSFYAQDYYKCPASSLNSSITKSAPASRRASREELP